LYMILHGWNLQMEKFLLSKDKATTQVYTFNTKIYAKYNVQESFYWVKLITAE
jgi:hypothetical protein